MNNFDYYIARFDVCVCVYVYARDEARKLPTSISTFSNEHDTRTRNAFAEDRGAPGAVRYGMVRYSTVRTSAKLNLTKPSSC